MSARFDPIRLTIDSEARLEWTRETLERAANGSDKEDALRDIAAFLVWLEVLARVLHPGSSPAGDNSELPINSDDARNHVRRSGGEGGPAASVSLPVDEIRRNHRGGGGPGAHGEDKDSSEVGLPSLTSAYMLEMVRLVAARRSLQRALTVLPPPPQYGIDRLREREHPRATTPSTPLPVSDPLALHAAHALATERDRPEPEVLTDLLQQVTPVATETGPAQLDMLLSRRESSEHPQRLPSSVMRAITASLKAARQSEQDTQARRRAHRQAVAAVLDHYISTQCSVPKTCDAALLEAIWPDEAEAPGRATDQTARVEEAASTPRNSAEGVELASHEPDDDEEADTRSIATGIREAQESIARRDDKLRWLLGENFQAGGALPVSATASPNGTLAGKTKRTAVPLELPASVSFAPSGRTNSTISGTSSFRSYTPHLRHSSISTSSVAPLLRHRRSVSTLGNGRISEADVAPHPTSPLQRKRSLSTGEGIQLLTAARETHSESSLWSSGVKNGRPALGPVAAPSNGVDKPLANLAPAIDSPSPSSSIVQPQLDSNTLTNEQRRQLVRRSKKLEGFFGVPFQEEAAQRVLVDGHVAATSSIDLPGGAGGADEATKPHRPPPLPLHDPSTLQASSATQFPPRSPGSAASSAVSPLSSPRRAGFAAGDGLSAPRMTRSSSSPSRRSSSFSSLASVDHAYYSEQSRRFSSAEQERQQREREERRKKLDKVRRVLGERVPAEIVVQCEDSPVAPPRHANGTGHVKSASEHWRRGKRLITGKGDPTPPAYETTTQNRHEWPLVTPDWQPSESQRRSLEASQNGVVDALSKARKLENLFGQLPPTSLYLGPESRQPLRHRRSVSDVASVYSPFARDATAGGWRIASEGLGNSTSSRETAETYRRSIASLSYVAERDPAAFAEVVRVYTARSHEEAMAEADEPAAVSESEEGQDAALEGPLMARSISAQSMRAARQAHKLSQVLGTTKGEVWHLLLRDLQEAILDDETLEEEERGEVLRSLDKLRRTGVDARNAGRS
ncbi:hypothetical protein JCM10908_002841 [Rhodotorula pacifica]|uniref:uncharacterized protein n=1 Tax=Rhodotorula pacifica TaxID=1495444 RepID=UPI00317753C7